MAGKCIARPPDSLQTTPSKSALRAGFSIIPFIFIFALSCGGPGRSGRADILEQQSKSILNIRLLDDAGPLLGNEIDLLEPAGIAVNKLGEIYISDRELNVLVRFSAKLEMLSFEGGIGSGLGDFNRPSGISCDAAMNVYVADYGNGRIQILDRNLRPASEIKEYFKKDGSAGSFEFPADVAIDQEGNMWVADDDRVLKINPFNELELELSYDSIERLDIGKAVSVAVSPAGNIAIGDSGNRKVFIVTSYGNLLSEFHVASVSSVAWDGNSLVWISSSVGGTLSAYDFSGSRIFVFSEPRILTRPASLAVGGGNILMVSDSESGKILRLEVIRNKAIQPEG